MPRIVRAAMLALGLLVVCSAGAKPPSEPPRGPFGLSRVTTTDGKPTDIDDFFLDEACGLCHRRQLPEVSGSMHSIAHHDRFYRLFAEVAREEAGEEVYTYCSGCHTAGGVVSGLFPGKHGGKHDDELPEEATAGVTCDVCHQMTRATGPDGPWGEPGNASFVLDPGGVKYGAADDIKKNPAHKGARRAFYETSEYCANCHTIIHPTNGLRIEHTYAEWKASPYAEKGIQCQDCHMRSVEDARVVARTMKPVTRKGKWMPAGREREIAPHYFVGGNSNAHRLGGDEKHSAMARDRLRSAAELLVRDAGTNPAGFRTFEVVVRNVGAGHKLPTSLTEIREMWIEYRVTAADGRVLLASGVLDAAGEIPADAIRFGALMEDAAGKVTVRPWEGVRFRSKRLVPPKGEDVTRVAVPGTGDAAGDLTVEARLLYRSASPSVIREFMKDEAFEAEIVEMAKTKQTLPAK